MLVLNAFSFGMIPTIDGHSVVIKATPISVERVADMLRDYGVDSAVGHSDTAALFSSLIGVDVPMNRVTVHGVTRAILGQLNGPRLPEGATTLPEGASITWMFIEVSYTPNQ